MKACFGHYTVPSAYYSILDLIDHRYFYHQLDNGRGSYTCGLIRDAVAEKLLELEVNFADTHFLTSLADNPATAGFMIKYAVLSSIRSNGLAIDAEIGKPMELRYFMNEPYFSMNATDKPMLCLPRKYIFKAIDGIIVLTKREKKNAKGKKQKNAKGKKENAQLKKRKLFMFPLRITLASSHSDSHSKFFEEYYHMWTSFCSFDVVPEFLWITPKQHEIREHSECSKWPAHIERYIPLMDASEAIGTAYQCAEGLLDGAQAGLAGEG